MPAGKDAGAKTRRPLPGWPYWAAALVLLALLWPLVSGENLRLTAAGKALQKQNGPARRVLLDFQRVYALDERGSPVSPADRARLWREAASFPGPHAEFIWMALCYLEARAGDLPKAAQALHRAQALDPKAVFLAKGPAWDPWRKALGLPPP